MATAASPSAPGDFAYPEIPGCQGQQRLEAQLKKEMEDNGKEFAEISAVYAGTTCLHLAPAPASFAWMMALLLPVIHGEPGKKPYLGGVAGVRLDSVHEDRVALRMWDGHGRLVLHTGAEGLATWREWEQDELAELLDGETYLSLRQLQHLHPLEHSKLTTPPTDIMDTLQSWTLRLELSKMPVIPSGRCHHDRLLLPAPVHRPDPHTARSPQPGPHEEQGCVPPSLLTRAPLADPRPADLGQALAHQLAALIASGRIRAGDVLTDPIGIVAQIGGRSAAARWAQQVIHHVAHRYGLLRYRPLRPGDPAPPRQAKTHVWAVSEAAAGMVRTLRDEEAPGPRVGARSG
ncbi:hypothetical protein [Streptomyces mobaraensis]|uniref:hypothetical protein n=1 Tax=Streptomyces mobaraensis TaxID=35621 RepID=UPI00187757A9|nr:hypothetical protein [Streptomyces mobaraensis]